MNRILPWVGLLVIIVALVWWGNRETPVSTNQTTTLEQRNVEMLTTNNAVAVQTEPVTYFGTTQGFYAEPQEAGEYPGIIMIHEWWGLNDHIKAMAQTLAQEGYRVIAVDLYNGKVATTTADAQKYRTSLTQTEALNNLKAAKTFLQGKGATKIASLGWCFGGGKSLELAVSGEPLDATVMYYGTLINDKTQLSKIKWPILGIFGEADTSIPAESVRTFDTNLDSLSILNEIYIYPGVGHAFANPSGMNYAANETKDAWAKTLTFLETHLK